jgi:hypothetical protein
MRSNWGEQSGGSPLWLDEQSRVAPRETVTFCEKGVECEGSGSLTIMALQVLLHFARSRLGQDAIAHEHTINRFAVPHFDLIP